MHVDGPTFKECPSEYRTPAWHERISSQVLIGFTGEAKARTTRIGPVFGAMQSRLVGLTKPRRKFDKRIEHRLQIECRAADDLEHIGGGGLLL